MMEIRIADADQYSDAIANLIQTAFAEQAAILKLTPERFPNFVGFETPDRTYWRLTHGDIALLAWIEGQLIGTISYQAQTEKEGAGYIKRLALLPEFRGYNRGSSLMLAAEENLSKAGISRAEISIVAEFKPLHNYYRKLGYLDGALTPVPSLPFTVQYLYKML